MPTPKQLTLALDGYPSPITGRTYDKAAALCMSLSSGHGKLIASIHVLEVAHRCYIQAWFLDLGNQVVDVPLKIGPVFDTADLALIHAVLKLKRYVKKTAKLSSAIEPSTYRIRKLNAWLAQIHTQQHHKTTRQPALFV